MTKEALKKLNEKQKHYCETLSVLVERYRIKGDIEETARYRGKLRGYLEALEDLEIIKTIEKRGLYLYYMTKRQGEQSNEK